MYHSSIYHESTRAGMFDSEFSMGRGMGTDNLAIDSFFGPVLRCFISYGYNTCM